MGCSAVLPEAHCALSSDVCTWAAAVMLSSCGWLYRIVSASTSPLSLLISSEVVVVAATAMAAMQARLCAGVCCSKSCNALQSCQTWSSMKHLAMFGYAVDMESGVACAVQECSRYTSPMCDAMVVHCYGSLSLCHEQHRRPLTQQQVKNEWLSQSTHTISTQHDQCTINANGTSPRGAKI